MTFTRPLTPKHALPLLCALTLFGAGCGGSKSSSKSASATAAATSASGASASSGAPAGAPVASSAPLASSAASAPSGASAAVLQVSSIDPTQGPLDGGTRVRILGAGFQAPGAGQTLVLFGTQAVLTTPLSDSELELVAPRGVAVGQADLRVVNERGAALLSAAWSYAPRAASLSFTPPVGHHELGLGGTRIRLELAHAAGLSPTAEVRFDQTPATSLAFLDSHTILVEVPQGVAPGVVELSVEDQGQVVRAPGFKVQGDLAYADLTVNEFCAHPGGLDMNKDDYGDSKADEFVEIVNTTGEWLDLSYLAIFDGADRERHRFLNPTVLPPGGAIVVFGGGTPEGFAPRNESGQAQQAVADELALNNTSDSIEIRTMPGLNPTGRVLFRVEYSAPPSGASFVNRNDGQAILVNPALSADYEDHSAAAGALGPASPGRRKDGSKF